MWSLVMGALVSSEEEGEAGDNTPLQPGGVEPGVNHPNSCNKDSVLQSESYNTDKVMGSQECIKKDIEVEKKTNHMNPIKQQVQYKHITNQGMSRREDGDGMEKPTLVKNPSEIFQGVVLPETGLALAKIPPIADKVDLLPVVPRSTLVREKAKVYPKGTYPPSVKKAREARFIPCEPYKGAVTPLAKPYKGAVSPLAKPYKGSVPPLISKTLSSPTLTSNRFSPEKKVSATNLHLVRTLPAMVDDSTPVVGDDCEEELEPMEHSGGGLVMNPLLEANYRAMLDAKERELDRLRLTLSEAEKQLRIQGQVNGELKSLLVASVGEDIEARLDFLTQDKARLAADVVNYNNKISKDWEEKEALGVESDIWRSKFLASTVILEEVTRSKQVLESRTHQLEHTARRMIIERRDFATKLNVADSMLKNLLPPPSSSPLPQQTSPSPTPTTGGERGEIKAADESKDLGGLCTSIEANSRKISDKLPGDRVARYTPATEPIYKPTPPEKEMEHLLALAAQHSHESDLPVEASCRLTRGARTMLLTMGDKAQSPGKSAFESCSHCEGTVETV